MLLLTQNRLHNDQGDMVLDIEFAFIAFQSEILDTFCDTAVKDGNIALQDWQTERRVQQFSFMFPSVS